MDHDQWRAALIIEQKDEKYMDIGIQRLMSVGFQHIHVMTQKGVTVSKRYQPLAHQANSWTCGYSLWRGAIELLSETYSATHSMFLLTRPNFHFWDTLMQYCESTIDENSVGVWSPFTPDRVFPSENVQRPVCRGEPYEGGAPFGWCPTQVSQDASVAECLVMTNHMLTLVQAYLPQTSPGGVVGSAIASIMARQRVPFHYHIPSLATTEEHTLEASDFVGVMYRFPRREMQPAKRTMTPVTQGRRRAK